MNVTIVSATFLDRDQVYLSNTDNIAFSENINKACEFDSIDSARYKLSSRFISLSYWISKQNNVSGIEILEIDKSKNIIRRERYL